MLISDQMIKELQCEAVMTRRVLECVTDDQISFSPGHGLHTVGWNAAHLAEIVGWAPGIIEADELDIGTVDSEGAAAMSVGDAEAILARFDANLAASIKSLQGVGDDVMDQPWTMKMGGQELFTMKKGDCIRKWIFTHTAHHRGILCVYLRITGTMIGSIYEG